MYGLVSDIMCPNLYVCKWVTRQYNISGIYEKSEHSYTGDCRLQDNEWNK